MSSKTKCPVCGAGANSDDVARYLAAIGSKGGKATGKRKARPTAHYKAAAAKRWGKREQK